MWCNKQNVIFMEELNEETILNELSKFVDIAPQINLYVPQYVQNRIQELKLSYPSYNELIDFIKAQGYHCFYFNKSDFIVRNREGQLYLDKNAFKDALDKIFKNYTNFNEECRTCQVEQGCKTLLKTNLGANTVSGLHVIVPNTKLQIVINYNIPNILPELTIFSELCYCLQAIYDDKIRKTCIFSEKELEKNDKEISKNIFLERYRSRTQTLLFASLIILLNNKENPKFNDLINNLVYQNLYYPAKSGWLVYPLLQEEIRNIRENPNEYDKFKHKNTQEQSMDYQELYKYSMKKVEDKYAEYKAFLSNKEKSVKELIYREILQNLQNIKQPDSLLFTFNKTISDLIQDVANKTLSLEQCKKRLEPIKVKISQNKSAILDKLATDLVAKYKTDVENVK